MKIFLEVHTIHRNTHLLVDVAGSLDAGRNSLGLDRLDSTSRALEVHGRNHHHNDHLADDQT